MKKILLSGVVLAFTAMPALAGPGTISGPHVTKGKTELELKGTYAFDYDNDNSNLQNELELNHGLTDNLRASIKTKTQDRNNSNAEFASVGAGLRYELGNPEQYLIDTAFDLSYSRSVNSGVDEIAFKLINQKQIADYKLRTNIKFEHEIGDGSRDGVELKLSAGAYNKFAKHETEFGIEYFGDIGFLNNQNGYSAQSHYIGPAVKTSVPLGGDHEVDFTLGYYQGISHAADDGTVRYKVEYEF